MNRNMNKTQTWDFSERKFNEVQFKEIISHYVYFRIYNIILRKRFDSMKKIEFSEQSNEG